MMYSLWDQAIISIEPLQWYILIGILLTFWVYNRLPKHFHRPALIPFTLVIVNLSLAWFIPGEIVLVFSITSLAMYLFIKQLLPIDVVAILIMTILMTLKIVTPEQGVSGFSNHAVITILALFILSYGIEKTGIINSLSYKASKITKSRGLLQLVVVLIITAIFSGFLNNAAVVAVMIPFIYRMTHSTNTFAGKLLIPLSYTSMAAGMLTVIGTSTNILANSILEQYAIEGRVIHGTLIQSFDIFGFWEVGLITLLITVVYFLIFGYWILPKKNSSKTSLTQIAVLYTAEILINKNAQCIGMTYAQSPIRTSHAVKVHYIRRASQQIKYSSYIRTRAGDRMIVSANRETLHRIEQDSDYTVFLPQQTLQASSFDQTIELVIPHGSRYIAKRIKDIVLDQGYKLAVMAVQSGAKTITRSIESMKLATGDRLLVKVENTTEYQNDAGSDLLTIDTQTESYRIRKQPIAIGIMGGVILFAATGVYPIVVTSLIGVVLMIFFGVLTTEEAYASVKWDIIFLLAGIIPLGIAFDQSGAATYIADILSIGLNGLPPIVALMGLYVGTSIITEVLSNNASVILLIPIGMTLAETIGVHPQVIALTIMFAASSSFLTPIGYQTNTMVYGSGCYKFSDFLRVGIVLKLILAIATPYLIFSMY